MVELGMQGHVLAGLSCLGAYADQGARPRVVWVDEPVRCYSKAPRGDAEPSDVW